MGDLWFERCETIRVHAVTGAENAVRLGRRRGLGEARARGGTTAYRWCHVTGGDDLRSATPAWFHRGLDELTAPWEPEPARLAAHGAAVDALQRRAAELDWGRTEVTLRDVDQRVMLGRDGGRREDRRRHVVVSMLVPAPDGASIRPVRREAWSRDGGGITGQALDDLVVELATQRELPAAEDVEAGEWPVVLAPGHCGLFFHEICGHPLEGDIVASGTSYLGSQMGHRVGPACLTLRDDVASPHCVCGYELDDEGVPPAPVRLIEAGIVTEPLLDGASATALGRPANGRGRRVDYLHSAIPRQAHTAVAPGEGDAASLVAGIRYGLLVQRLRLRHMSTAGGEFGFWVTEGRVIRDGEIGPPVRECAIRGTGLATLERIEAVGADTCAFFGGGGCNKVDQGPLFVSCEQPSIRIQSMRVDPCTR
jgi:TldD protein